MNIRTQFRFVPTHRRFNSGRLVCNIDSSSENIFLTASELGTCGRPLQAETDLTLPLSKEMILPESLEADSDLKQAERQRPSNEACQAQKGTKRWCALLSSLLTMSGDIMKNKPCIVLNLTGYIEDVGCAVSWLQGILRELDKQLVQTRTIPDLLKVAPSLL